MAGKKLSAKKIERMEYLQSYIEDQFELIQQSGVEIYIDWNSVHMALQEMRKNLPQPESE